MPGDVKAAPESQKLIACDGTKREYVFLLFIRANIKLNFSNFNVVFKTISVFNSKKQQRNEDEENRFGRGNGQRVRSAAGVDVRRARRFVSGVGVFEGKIGGKTLCWHAAAWARSVRRSACWS